MVDVTVDAKPMPQNRVDPDVKIPDSVRRASAAVDALYQQPPKSEPPPPTASAPTPQPVVPEPPAPHASEPPAADPNQLQPPAADSNQLQLPMEGLPPSPPPAPDSSSPENVTQATIGRNQALQRQLGEQQEQLEQLAAENLRLQQLIEQPRPRAPASAQHYLTAEDEKNFGHELLDVAIRAARHATGADIGQLRAENEELRREVSKNTKSAIDQYLDQQVPNWREINANERFHKWLLLPDLLSGAIRDRLLKDAARAANAPRVAGFFKSFLAEEAATGHMEPSPSPSPVKPPRAAAIPLASLASPGRERPANGGIPTGGPADKPTYTGAEIQRLSRMYMRGLIPEADYQRISADIALAGKEGRVIG